MNNVSELALNYLQSYNCHISEDYVGLLRSACEIHPPPHGMAKYGNLYRECARDRQWFANSLAVNAYEEGYGSKQVWEFAQRIENRDFARLVRGHSIDESRHSKMFVALLDILFPTELETEVREEFKSFSPEYYPHSHPPIEPSPEKVIDKFQVMDQIIQINLLEIRALILQLLLRPVAQAYATNESLPKVTCMSNLFIYDETKHVEYSAYCIGEFIKEGNCEWVREKIIQSQQTINEMFLIDTETDHSLGTTVLKTQVG